MRIRAGIEKQFEAIKKWYEKSTCEHYWKPGLTSKGPCRWCPWCKSIESMTNEEFYARFGRMPIL